MIELGMLLAATGGMLRARGRVERFAAFASDSREAQADECFVAVRGMRADGHDSIEDAIRRGAAGILVEAARVAEGPPERWDELGVSGAAVIVVPDVRLALRQYSAAILRAWGPRVIAIAGSAGKTTAKEAIATILSQQGSTFRSWRNYNDLLGVPLALGRLEPHHRFAVLEFGCDYPGEIAELAAMVRPQVAVLLNVLATHLDTLGSLSGVAEALAALPQALGPEGLAILNEDDEAIQRIALDLAARPAAPQIERFSMQGSARFRALIQPSTDPDEPFLKLTLRLPGSKVSTTHLLRGFVGTQWRAAILAALATTAALGVDPVASARALEDFAPLPGRMRLLTSIDGRRLIDDSHSALPDATSAALAELWRLGRLWHRPRVAVLGDMLHLGATSAAAHEGIGRQAAQQVDWLVTRGALAEQIAHAARLAGMDPGRIIITHTARDAAAAVLEIPDAPEPPVVLVKGSPAMRMEQVAEILLGDSARAAQELDRRRAIWQREVVGDLQRPTWVEVDLTAIGDNCRALTAIVGPQTAVMATLKADAYGHGAVKVAHTVLRNGASWLGVATVSEAAPLRAADIDAPILVYGFLPPWQAQLAVRLQLRATIYDGETARALSQAAQALGQVARVHVKVDSGMGRLGLRAEDPGAVAAFMHALRELPGIEVEGIYMHFATADEADLAFAQEQLRRFRAVLAALDVRPPIVHAANSAALLRLPEARFDMVRPGIALFGMQPSADAPLPARFRPALSLKTQIALVKTVPADEGIGYGRTYSTSAPERVATLPVGYADGFRRSPANWGEVLIRGQRAPIRGRVSMDQTVVSVDHIPAARAGDEVVLIGRQGDDAITAEEVARRLGTINYEVVAALLARVPRVTG